jgi:site-specific recombinase XerD
VVRVHEGPPDQYQRGFSQFQPTENRPIRGVLTPDSLSKAVEAFLLSRSVGGCTSRTVQLYREVLTAFTNSVAVPDVRECSLVVAQTYLTRLRERVNATTTHLHFSKLRAFFAWCVESGLLSESPLRGVSMRAPKTLPRVPEDETVRRLLQACSDTFEGRRNRALVALLADSGLRISEALRLRIEDVNFAARTVNVRAGKGQKDGVGFFGAETAQHLRNWLAKRREAQLEDHLFTDKRGRSLTRSHGVHILHRLSERAGLPRKVGPHASPLHGDIYPAADWRPRTCAPSAQARELGDGAPLRTPYQARCEREVPPGESVR